MAIELDDGSLDMESADVWPTQGAELGMSTITDVTIYTDGACIGNPGPGGYGVVLLASEARKELSGGFVRTTNNRMELLGAIVGLEILKHRCHVRLVTDSQYVINGIKQGWAKGWRKKGWMRKTKPVRNADLWNRLLLCCENHEVKFQWVRGHTGVPENERCDQLAMAAAQSDDLEPDHGFVGTPSLPRKTTSSDTIDAGDSGFWAGIRSDIRNQRSKPRDP